MTKDFLFESNTIDLSRHSRELLRLTQYNGLLPITYGSHRQFVLTYLKYNANEFRKMSVPMNFDEIQIQGEYIMFLIIYIHNVC